MPLSQEFKLEKPAIFSDPSLDWVSYGETRRTDNKMSGNMGDRSSVINPDTHLLVAPDMPYEQWAAQEIAAVQTRDHILRTMLNLDSIGYPQPEHDTSLINLDQSIDDVSINKPAADRTWADATFLSKPGYASSFTPADCPIINVVDAVSRTVAQIHTGYQGLEKNIIQKSFDTMLNVSAKDALVYISPHGRENYVVFGPVLDRLRNNPMTREFVTTSEGTSYFAMSALAAHQLHEVGVRTDAIQISHDNSLTDPTLYSQRNYKLKGANGRNGVVLGIKK
jgi:copper oxidase (laccase) domain-containing protein